jgi:hypothetical protein
MSASDNLNGDQFMSIDELRNLRSVDFPGGTVGSARTRSRWLADAQTYSRGSWREHGGPEGYLSHLTEDVRANGVHTPIEVVQRNGKPSLWDGHHRAFAAIDAGIEKVPYVNKGTHDEAMM